MNYNQYLCPVCGQHRFRINGTNEICPVCSWINDSIQNAEPDSQEGENKLSLNEHKNKWLEMNTHA